VQVAGAGERFVRDRTGSYGGWSGPVRLLHFGAALPSARSNERPFACKVHFVAGE
jgi:hypothetical protein